MTLKVLCTCGTKFAFDVDPVDGRMPVAVACPDCGSDATELANEQIRQQLSPSPAAPAAPAPAPGRIPIRVPAAPAKQPATTPPAAFSAPTLSQPPAATPVAAASPARIHVNLASPASSSSSAPRVSPVAPTSGSTPRLSVAGHVTSPPPSPPSPPDEVVSGVAPEPAAESAAPAAPGTNASAVRCSRHPLNDATESCFVCGKPICPECMAQFGYLCSPYCEEQARRKELPVPVYAGQKKVLWQKEVRTGNRLVTVLAVAAGLVLVSTGLYKFWLSRPKVAFSLNTPKAVPFLHAQFVGPDWILAATSQRVSLREWKTDRELWSFPLTPPAAEPGNRRVPAGDAGTLARLGGDQAVADEVHVRIVGSDVWVASMERVVSLDLASGSKKAEVRLSPPVDQIAGDDQGFLAVGSTNPFIRSVTRVDFKTGQASTDTVRLPVVRRRPPAAQTETDPDAPLPPPDTRAEVLPSGSGAISLTARLLEARIVQRDAVKPSKRSVMDKEGGVTAADSLDAATEMLNQNQAPVTEDQSLYQVTVRRLFAGGPEWSGSVTGTPSIFPLKTVDLLVAGASVATFDRNNRKIWEARLNYGVGPRFNRGFTDPDSVEQPGGQPAVESGARIYFFDQGTLTAFDSRDGRVAWRLPSVGITQVVPSGSTLYIATTTAGPDSIQYSKDLTLNEKIVKVLQKVDASTGRVLWSQERMGDDVRVSGNFLYAAVKKRYLMDGVGEDDTRLHYYLRRLDPGDGKVVWEYYQRGVADTFEARESLLLLRFPDEIRLLKFFAL